MRHVGCLSDLTDVGANEHTDDDLGCLFETCPTCGLILNEFGGSCFCLFIHKTGRMVKGLSAGLTRLGLGLEN